MELGIARDAFIKVKKEIENLSRAGVKPLVIKKYVLTEIKNFKNIALILEMIIESGEINEKE